MRRALKTGVVLLVVSVAVGVLLAFLTDPVFGGLLVLLLVLLAGLLFLLCVTLRIVGRLLRPIASRASREQRRTQRENASTPASSS